jgi:predicted transcriptional regulator of viral defense system
MNELDRLAQRQHGVVTPPQLAKNGWSEDDVDRSLSTGELFRIRQGALRMRGSPPTREQSWIAAVLAAGEDAYISFLTAAANFDFVRVPGPAEIDLVVFGRNRIRMDGVRGHQTIALPRSHTTVHKHIRTTTVERTLCDICGTVGPRELLRVVADLQRRRLLTVPRLVRTFEEIPVSGGRVGRCAPFWRN